MTTDIFQEIKKGAPICEKDGQSRKWAATYTARRGRTPHRFQPVFDRAASKDLRRRVDRAVMRDYATQGPHFWDGRHEDW